MFACTGEPDFSNVPEIGFNKIELFFLKSLNKFGQAEKRDSVVITINFQDGDGDLGANLTQAEILKLVQANDDRLKTFIVDTYVSKNGKFIKSNLADPNGGFLPIRLKDGTKSGPIEGTIAYSTVYTYGLFGGDVLLKGKNDTLKFAVQIKDRALNKSNVVETTPIFIYTK